MGIIPIYGGGEGGVLDGGLAWARGYKVDR